MTTGAGEDIAAWFLISGQRISGEPGRPRGVAQTPLFWYNYMRYKKI